MKIHYLIFKSLWYLKLDKYIPKHWTVSIPLSELMKASKASRVFPMAAITKYRTVK